MTDNFTTINTKEQTHQAFDALWQEMTTAERWQWIWDHRFGGGELWDEPDPVDTSGHSDNPDDELLDPIELAYGPKLRLTLAFDPDSDLDDAVEERSRILQAVLDGLEALDDDRVLGLTATAAEWTGL